MKVMTYNVHSCIDLLGRNSLDRIAQLIKRENIAIAGLNEIETFSPRTRFADQPKKIAQAKNMAYQYGPTVKLGPFGFFGNAVLSSYKIVDQKNIRLPGSAGWELRYCLSTTVRIPNGYLKVMSTHLGLNKDDRREQINRLAEEVYRSPEPVLLMGDFNCTVDELGPVLRLLTDTGGLFGGGGTYPADSPRHRIDYIFTSPWISCNGLYIPVCDASDHLPVIADLQLP